MNVISLQSQSFKYENSIGCKDKRVLKSLLTAIVRFLNSSTNKFLSTFGQKKFMSELLDIENWTFTCLNLFLNLAYKEILCFKKENNQKLTLLSKLQTLLGYKIQIMENEFHLLIKC